MFKQNILSTKLSKNLIFFLATVFFFVACLLFAAPLSVSFASTTVTTYPGPTGLAASDLYSVTVNGTSSFVNKSISQRGDGITDSWTDFAFSGGSITIVVTKLTGTLNSVKVRPSDYAISPTISGNTATFTLSEPRKLSVEFNGDLSSRLFLFADAPEVSPPSPTDPNVIYFAPGIYDIGPNYSIPSGKTLYIAGGAYVKGTINNDISSNVTIAGRGIFSGENYPHQDGPGLIQFRNTTGITMDGVTLIDSPGYTITSSGDNSILNTYNNLKIIGWLDNTDGIHPGAKATITDCFMQTYDDAIDIGQGVFDLTATNNVIWTTGSALQFSWVSGGGGNVTVDNLDIIHADTHPSFTQTLISMQHGGSGNLNNYLIQNVRVENFTGANKRFLALAVAPNAYAHSQTVGSLSNVIFRNIQIDEATSGNYINGYSNANRVQNITFENLSVAGTVATTPSQAGITLNSYTSDINFTSTVSTVPSSGAAPTSYQLSTDMTAKQGKNHWYYLEWNGNNYIPMSWVTASNWWKGSGTYNYIMGPNNVHPDLNDSAIGWVAPFTGRIHITGNVKKSDTGGGDGVQVRILKNKTNIWPVNGWNYIAYNDSTGYNTDETLSVVAGDMIYFAVNKNGDNSYDATSWNPSITYTNIGANDIYGENVSKTQGYQGWYYQTYNGTSYTDLTSYSQPAGLYGSGYWNNPGTYNYVDGAGEIHPDAAETVISWVAPTTGTVRIKGEVYKSDITGGDGVNVKIVKNASQLWPATGWQSIAYNDTTGIAHDIIVNITAGDILHFVVDKNGTSSYDRTIWSPVVEYIPYSAPVIDPNIKFFGRWDLGSTGTASSNFPGAYLKVNFTGTTAKLKLGKSANIYVSIDNVSDVYYPGVSGTVNLTPIALSGGMHTLRVAARSENDSIQFQGLMLDPGSYTSSPTLSTKIIEFIGDSITSGYNNTMQNLSDYSWLTGEQLHVEHTQIAISGICLQDGITCYNSPSTAGMSAQFFKLKTIASTNSPDWDFSLYQPNTVVVNMGTNDSSIGVSDAAFQSTYTIFLQNIRSKYPTARIFVLRTFGGYKAASTQAAVTARNNAGDSLVSYIDTTGWITAGTNDFLPDGVHPSDSGMVKIANMLSSLLLPYIQTRIDDTSTAIQYTGNSWFTYSNAGAYGGSAHVVNGTGDYALYSFTGTGVQWIGGLGTTHGKADVYIDGVWSQTVDTYSAVTTNQAVLFSQNGLSNTTHTLKIVERSDHNISSSGNYTEVDAVLSFN